MKIRHTLIITGPRSDITVYGPDAKFEECFENNVVEEFDRLPSELAKQIKKYLAGFPKDVGPLE